MTLLATLPHSHPLRNTPLHKIRAEYRNLTLKNWKPISTIKIHTACYNDLSGPWIECNEWRAEQKPTE